MARRIGELPVTFISRFGVCASAAAALFFVTFPLHSQEMQQNYQQFEIDRGATLYSSNCEECHADGTGVPGVNLRTGQFPSGSSDDDIINAIRNGIPGTVMPPHDFSAPDLAALLAYIRFLARDQSAPVKLGDPQKGEALFQSNGCLNCHRVGDKGSYTALNLSDTGTLHPPSYLERVLLDPDSSLASDPGSRLVRAVTLQGKVVTGRRLNEDTFTIQLMDSQQNLVSLDKSDLRSLTIVEESPMPALKEKLTSDQLSDLVAYLASLKSPEAQPAPTQFGSPPGVGNGFSPFGRGRGPTPASTSPTSPAAPPVAPVTQPSSGAPR
jgi:putative heme-binding domain-containing protein